MLPPLYLWMMLQFFKDVGDLYVVLSGAFGPDWKCSITIAFLWTLNDGYREFIFTGTIRENILDR